MECVSNQLLSLPDGKVDEEDGRPKMSQQEEGEVVGCCCCIAALVAQSPLHCQPSEVRQTKPARLSHH